MSGHGWVTPNLDGSKARCGGPAICRECAVEAQHALRPPSTSGFSPNAPGGKAITWITALGS